MIFQYTDEDDYSEGEFEEMQEAFYKDSSTFLKVTWRMLFEKLNVESTEVSAEFSKQDWLALF